MIINQNSPIVISIIFSVTLIGVIALMRNTDTKINIDLDRHSGSLTIEGTQKSSLPENTKVDCLPGEENSQLLPFHN